MADGPSPLSELQATPSGQHPQTPATYHMEEVEEEVEEEMAMDTPRLYPMVKQHVEVMEGAAD